MPARADDRDLTLELDELFEHGLPSSQRIPGINRIGVGVDSDLPLAVVAESGGFQHGGTADLPDRLVQIVKASDRREPRDRQAVLREERLLFESMLCDGERLAARSDRRQRFGRGRRGRRHVLELERDDVDAGGELADPVEIVVRRLHFDVGDLPGRRVVLGRERVHAIAEAPGGHREHPAKLAAAEHANRRSGENRGNHRR